MGDEPEFATLESYGARYGTPADPERVEALLGDASSMLLTAYERRWGSYIEGAHPEFDRSAEAVACSIVSRALNVPEGMAGATQYSQTAGSYSASVTFANPTADLWLGKSDLRRLGLAGTRVWSIRPMVGADHGCP